MSKFIRRQLADSNAPASSAEFVPFRRTDSEAIVARTNYPEPLPIALEVTAMTGTARTRLGADQLRFETSLHGV